MAGKKGMKHYQRELKIEAIRMFFEEGMTRAEITQALSIGLYRTSFQPKAYLQDATKSFPLCDFVSFVKKKKNGAQISLREEGRRYTPGSYLVINCVF